VIEERHSARRLLPAIKTSRNFLTSEGPHGRHRRHKLGRSIDGRDKHQGSVWSRRFTNQTHRNARLVRVLGVAYELDWIPRFDASCGMKLLIVVGLSCLFLQHIASARKWTDTLGRTIEAEIVRADADSVTVLTGGREVKIPREKLSDEDQKYCDEWLEKSKDANDADDDAEAKPSSPAAVSGEMQFDGKPLIAGGKVNVFNYDYSPQMLNDARKSLKEGETGYRIGIAVPAGFDPSKPQRVFIANTAQNNDQQTAQGNTAMAGFFAKQCVEEGWICIAFDSNLGRPKHDGDMVSAFAKFKEIWPKFSEWKFVSGGFSGGGKAAFWPAAYLLKNGYQVTGLFLANTNQDFSEEARKFYKCKKSDYANVSVFWGTGKWDEVATKQTGDMMKNSLEKNGMKEVRVEFHEGKHSLFHPQFIDALKWFKEQG